MQHASYRRIVKTLRAFVTLALGIEVLLMLVILAIFLQTAIFQEDALLSAWPIEISESQTNLTVTSDRLSDVSILIHQGTIQFSADSAGYFVLKFIDTVFVLALAIGITFLLKKILNSLHQDRIFTTDNAQRMKAIALFVIIITPYSLLKSLIYRGFILSNTHVEGKEYASLFSIFSDELSSNQVWLNFNVNIQALLTGLVLLVIAEIFRAGVVIKLDNESIV